MKKKNLVIIIGSVIVLLIGIITVKMNTDKRKAEAEAAKSQTEKDAEALAERLDNPQTAEDYYQLFLAGKLDATTSKTGLFGFTKKVNLYDMYTYQQKVYNSNHWPDQLQMISYCMVKADDSDIPDLVLRFLFVKGNDKTDLEYFTCILRYLGNNNVKIIGQMYGHNNPPFVSTEGFLDGTMYQHPIKDTDPDYIATLHQYYRIGTSDDEVLMANIYELTGLKSCIIPKNHLMSSLANEDLLTSESLIDSKNTDAGYKFMEIDLAFEWVNESDDFYKENVFYTFTNADGTTYYPADPEMAKFYKEKGVNVLDPDKAETFLKDIFAEHGLNYDTCFDAPEVTWIDIQCPPWGPY